jgi:hypothetical protein
MQYTFNPTANLNFKSRDYTIRQPKSTSFANVLDPAQSQVSFRCKFIRNIIAMQITNRFFISSATFYSPGGNTAQDKSTSVFFGTQVFDLHRAILKDITLQHDSPSLFADTNTYTLVFVL